MKNLTDKQKRILEYITEATIQQGYPPSVREIGKHVGLSSSSSVHARLIKLREKGYLEKDVTNPLTGENGGNFEGQMVCIS